MLKALCRRLFALTAVMALAGCSAAEVWQGGNIAAPSNYRQLVAHKLRQWEPTIHSARISSPHDRFVGVQNGGTRPAVCVDLGVPSLIGTPTRRFYLFWFYNGQTDGSLLAGPMATCYEQALTHFSELAG